ncbi:MAG: GntR family transcriptional regulator, partial [Novosphingobium sp.]
MNEAVINIEAQGEGPDTVSAKNGSQQDTIQKLADGIVYCIRSGQMVPGQHLVESDLTRRFGVSRGSLREGLKHLAADGIVTLTRFRGAYISALDRKAVHDLLDVLEPLCTLAARVAATKGGTPEQLDNLCAIIDHNKLQISGRTSEVCNTDPIDEKFESFGWAVKHV